MKQEHAQYTNTQLKENPRSTHKHCSNRFHSEGLSSAVMVISKPYRMDYFLLNDGMPSKAAFNTTSYSGNAGAHISKIVSSNVQALGTKTGQSKHFCTAIRTLLLKEAQQTNFTTLEVLSSRRQRLPAAGNHDVFNRHVLHKHGGRATTAKAMGGEICLDS